MEAFGFGAAAEAAIRIYRDCRPNIHAEMTGQTVSGPKSTERDRVTPIVFHGGGATYP